jgi:hypothetical protein
MITAWASLLAIIPAWLKFKLPDKDTTEKTTPVVREASTD